MEHKVEVPFWALGVGALFVATWGALLWILARKTTPSINISVGNVGGVGGQPLASPMLAAPPSAPAPVYQTATADTAMETKPSKMNTYNLSTTEGTPVMYGGSARHWKVQLINVGPPGSIAYVANDPNLLAYPSMSAAVPAGRSIDVMVAPYSWLYAIGTVPRVQLSVTGSEALG